MSYLEIDCQLKNKHQSNREREGSNISRPSPVQPSTDDNRERGKRNARDLYRSSFLPLPLPLFLLEKYVDKKVQRTNNSSCHVHYYFSSRRLNERTNETMNYVLSRIITKN